MKTIKKTITVLLSLLILISATCGCSDKTEKPISMPASVSESDSDWYTAEENEIVLQNQAVKFVLNSDTTHFTVTDLNTEKSYSSVPKEDVFSFSDEDAQRLLSELTVTYYQKQSSAQLMFSAKDCVDGGNYKILTNGEAVRVYYNLGDMGEEFFAPAVFTKSDFEKLILGKMSNPNAQRRISRYYTLYSKDGEEEDFAEMAEIYPVLNKTPLYIRKMDAEDNVLEEISQFMDEVGYGEEQYEKVLKKYSIEVQKSDKPGFCIPVEYRLCDDGFTAEILVDKITENSESFKLQSIDFLEYFASRNENSDGTYVMPDGSGALIKINGSYKSDFSQSFYGTDYSVLEDSKSQLSQNLMLPVFGISETDGGIFAIIEKGAEMAELNIKSMSNSAPQNHIFTSFTLRAVDVTDIGEKTGVPVYNLFSKHLLEVSPKIRFAVLSEGKSEFSDMAKYYREYLKENKLINISNSPQTAPLYLDFLCMIKKKASVMGVSYDEKIVLSTIKEIIDAVEKLNEKGIKNIVLRLKGYGSGGLENKAYNRFEIDSAVGTAEELMKLETLLKENGGALYLDADFQFVYSKGNGFSEKNSTAHYLNRAVVYKGSYDIVTRQYNSKLLPKFFISPSLYGEYSRNYLKSLKGKLSGDFKVSFGSAGRYLGSDYASARDMDRAQSLYLLQEALKQTGTVSMFDNGNAYVMPFADAIFGVPLTSSANDMEYMQIPFYQMIVHGSIGYSGASVNLASDPKTQYLKSVEYGACLSATLITRENSLLTNTDYETVYYSVNLDGQLDSLCEMYRNSCDALSAVCGEEITGYERITDELYCVEYSNSVKIYVNYGKKEASVSGITVGAESFEITKE